MLVLGHIIVWIALFDWASSHIVVGILAPFLLPILYLLRTKERAVYQVTFDDEAHICAIYYYLFFFIKVRQVVPYDNAIFRYVPVQYLRGIYVNAFQIWDRKRLVVEIRQKYNAGWEKGEILELDKYVKGNPLLNYDKDVLKRIGGKLLPE